MVVMFLLVDLPVIVPPIDVITVGVRVIPWLLGIDTDIESFSESLGRLAVFICLQQPKSDRQVFDRTQTLANFEIDRKDPPARGHYTIRRSYATHAYVSC